MLVGNNEALLWSSRILITEAWRILRSVYAQITEAMQQVT